jgi:hypothetical protein
MSDNRRGLPRSSRAGTTKGRSARGYAAFLADNPNEIEYLRVLLGHKDYKMILLHYGHLIDQHEKINKKLEGFDPFGG